MKNVQFCGKTSKFLPKREREREQRERKRKRKRERGREREREREREKFVLNFELVIISEKSKI